ncbi:MAG: molybdopterin molybdotransferase MoeA [Flavobacteriaceae bacterium]|nr:molybdopterin molybdotransferase MoeA [Flavobacteriaceae bacterium]
MISVAEAIQIVQKNTGPHPNSIKKELLGALGYILFEDVISPIHMPPFRQSAMDGYALCLHDDLSYKVTGEVQAGDNTQIKLKSGEAVRIFTGAPVPNSANAVIMQEKVTTSSNSITLENTPLANDNIRALGAQITAGQIALTMGTTLNPAGIGFLSSLGITEVLVYQKPSVAIVVTGNELTEPGKPLVNGQIYESNALMLTGVLGSLGYQNVNTYRVDDNYKNTLEILQTTISQHDVILVSGGISVGDYDFVGKALQELKVTPLFYKVKQKPGKPLFFGKKDSKVIFALPGNPAAALNCFYIYVHLALQKLSGDIKFSIQRTQAKSQTSFQKKGDRAQFLKANYNNGGVSILDGQSSAMLHTFALANALVYIPEDVNDIKQNDLVEVILLPIN